MVSIKSTWSRRGNLKWYHKYLHIGAELKLSRPACMCIQYLGTTDICQTDFLPKFQEQLSWALPGGGGRSRLYLKGCMLPKA